MMKEKYDHNSDKFLKHRFASDAAIDDAKDEAHQKI